MLNKIWFWLLLIGILYGFSKAAYNSWSGRASLPAAAAEDQADELAAPASRSLASDSRGLQEMGKDLNTAALSAAETSVTICIGLIGIMALWLGLMNIAQEAGLVAALARAMQPIMRWLFPGVPDGHPAQGAVLMNISANMLGLENAATPLGLKAMRELQKLNPTRDTATDAMATFLAINTSNVTLIPIAIIGYRVAAGSENPAQPLAGIILTTSISTVVAVCATRWLSRWPGYRMPTSPPPTVPPRPTIDNPE